MIAELGWHDLGLRRRDMRLALLFKVVNPHGKENYAVTAENLNLQKADTRTRKKPPLEI